MVVNTETWRCWIRPIVKMASYWKCTTSEITKSSLQYYYENEDCEDAVVEQIAAKYQKTSEYQETDEDDTTKPEQVTNQDARKFIAGLRLYFMQEGNEDSPISALETCSDFVQLQSIKRTW
jgi:hypothetical protein